MKKIQTKLFALSLASLLCLAVFAGIVIQAAWQEYTGLTNFQRTSQISQTAYELAKSITDERQAGETFTSWLDRSGGASAIGVPGCPLSAFCTASIASARMAFASSRRELIRRAGGERGKR